MKALTEVQYNLPYFPAYNARVIYTKRIWNRKKMNMRGVH